MYQQKIVKLNQIELSYLEWNTAIEAENSQPVLMLHGMADNCMVWQKLGNYLSAQNHNSHLVAPDLRGHGNSSKPTTGYYYQDYFADLDNLYSYFDWQKVHIVAHSWSAKIACLWATKYPDKCRSLVLIDPFFINSMPSIFKITFPLLYKVLPFLKLMQSFSDYDTAKEVAKTLKQYQGWNQWQQQIFDYGIEKKANQTWSSKFPVVARNQIFEDVMQQAGLTTKINLPSLLVLPENGLNRSGWQIKPYQKYLTNLQIVKVPGNHWAFIVKPEEFNSTVTNFLINQ